MAEFAEVMRQAKRTCAAHGGMCNSRNCPLYNGEACRLDPDRDGEDYSDVERIIMAWAKEHPEPRYPTWSEWQKKVFPGAGDDMYPCNFLSYTECRCKGSSCDECRERPIPADIAEKLGIRPINEGCDTCKYTDKAGDEEPLREVQRHAARGQREMDGNA